jgi:hypothetical protein
MCVSKLRSLIVHLLGSGLPVRFVVALTILPPVRMSTADRRSSGDCSAGPERWPLRRSAKESSQKAEGLLRNTGHRVAEDLLPQEETANTNN